MDMEEDPEPLRPRFQRQDTLEDILDVISNDQSKSPLIRILEREESVDLAVLQPFVDYLKDDEVIGHFEEYSGPTSQDILDTSTSPVGVFAQNGQGEDDVDHPFGLGFIGDRDHAYFSSMQSDLNSIDVKPPVPDLERPPSTVIKHFPAPSPLNTSSPSTSYQLRKRKSSVLSTGSVSFYASDESPIKYGRPIKSESTDFNRAKIKSEPTDDHRARRDRNNEAVRNCREKKKREMEAIKKQRAELEVLTEQGYAKIDELENELQAMKTANAILEARINQFKRK